MTSVDFAYLFARVLAEYKFGFDELLDLSIKRFWFLSNQVERIWAEKEMRQLQLLTSASGAEAAKAVFERLDKTVGKIWVFEPERPMLAVDTKSGLDPNFDRAGLHKLKSLLA